MPDNDQETTGQESVRSAATIARLIARAHRTGAQPVDIAGLYLEQARALLVEAPDSPRTLTAARRALELAEQANGPDSALVVPAVSCLAQAYQRLSRHAPAQALFERALKLHDASGADDTGEVADVISGIISSSCASGQCVTSESLYRRLIGWRERVLGRDHPHTIAACVLLAENLERQQKNRAAKTVYMDIVSRARVGQPDMLADLLTRIGGIEYRSGNRQQAVESINAALRLSQPGTPSHDRATEALARIRKSR